MIRGVLQVLQHYYQSLTFQMLCKFMEDGGGRDKRSIEEAVEEV